MCARILNVARNVSVELVVVKPLKNASPGVFCTLLPDGFVRFVSYCYRMI